mmetsp:Transcript_43000/g.84294  ORF Transcript_43000/g.84294 Transcript_43000/m.84294 type:complete len:221 (-) Transcript_43000:242-904(-)
MKLPRLVESRTMMNTSGGRVPLRFTRLRPWPLNTPLLLLPPSFSFSCSCSCSSSPCSCTPPSSSWNREEDGDSTEDRGSLAFSPKKCCLLSAASGSIATVLSASQPGPQPLSSLPRLAWLSGPPLVGSRVPLGQAPLNSRLGWLGVKSLKCRFSKPEKSSAACRMSYPSGTLHLAHTFSFTTCTGPVYGSQARELSACTPCIADPRGHCLLGLALNVVSQ